MKQNGAHNWVLGYGERKVTSQVSRYPWPIRLSVWLEAVSLLPGNHSVKGLGHMTLTWSPTCRRNKWGWIKANAPTNGGIHVTWVTRVHRPPFSRRDVAVVRPRRKVRGSQQPVSVCVCVRVLSAPSVHPRTLTAASTKVFCCTVSEVVAWVGHAVALKKTVTGCAPPAYT